MFHHVFLVFMILFLAICTDSKHPAALVMP